MARKSKTDPAAVAAHAIWKARKEAGLLRNGRMVPAGGVMGYSKSKAAKNSRACRGRVREDR